jgi:hypothetical protein
MCGGVGKSGWPMPRLMIDLPCAASALARASTSKADSVPSRALRGGVIGGAGTDHEHCARGQIEASEQLADPRRERRHLAQARVPGAPDPTGVQALAIEREKLGDAVVIGAPVCAVQAREADRDAERDRAEPREAIAYSHGQQVGGSVGDKDAAAQPLSAVLQNGGIVAIGEAELLGLGEAAQGDFARGRLPCPSHRPPPQEHRAGIVERRPAIVPDAGGGPRLRGELHRCDPGARRCARHRRTPRARPGVAPLATRARTTR